MRSELSKKTVRFGAFALNLDTGELRRHGIRVRLQDKSFQILQALLEQSPDVVTRDDLRKRLWPDDTFVDFESGLNTAVNRLRLALGDSAENPSYVETVARKGYRFIGVVADESELAEPVRVETTVTPVPPPPLKRSWTAAAILAGAALIALAVWTMHRTPPQPNFRQITFRRGIVGNARFGPDGQTILYSANWQGEGPKLYLANTVSPESRLLGYPHIWLSSVSPTSELAMITLDSTSRHKGGTLSRVPLNGGSPLTVATGVFGAEWAGDGRSLAVYRKDARESVIEYPIGKIIYHTPGHITDLRFSPRGDEFAFMEHPMRGDDAGIVRLIDFRGATRALTGWWASASGLAWAPSGKEIWFTASKLGARRSLYAVTLGGAVRQIASVPGKLMLYDISRDGQVLLGIDRDRMMVEASLDGNANEYDATWFDWSHAADLSTDGKLMLFDETGEAGGPNHGVFLRNAANDSVVRLGDGVAMALSPDQKWAIALNTNKPTSLTFLPVGPDTPHTISGNGLSYRRVRYFPDGQRLLVAGSFQDQPLRLFIQPAKGGPPVPIHPDVYLDYAVVSADGKQIAGLDPNQHAAVVPAAGGEPRQLPIRFPALPLQWSADGKALFVEQIGCCPPVKIHRYDLATGQTKLWKQFSPSDPVGISYVLDAVVAANERSYAYSYLRSISELFVVDGWR